MRAAPDVSAKQLLISPYPSGANVLELALPEIDAQADVIASDAEESVFIFPATSAQRRFWLLDQIRPDGNPALNMSVALRWRGPLEPTVLQRALNEVVSRHEALRTTFESDRGQLQQLIAPTLRLDLPVRDAAAADDPIELMLKEAQEPLDLSRGPLLRGRLIRFDPLEHLLLLTVHHIVSDGWSNGILTRDLCAFYTAFLQGKSAPLPELTIQFADYADWQQGQLTEDCLAPQRAYWREKLTGELPGLDLPIDRPRRAGADSSGAIRSRLLPPELAGAAKAMAAGENTSPFMIFFAVFQALLHRYTGQVDFLVTTPSANRERREFESLVGLFVNPLLLRADLQGEPSFRDLLGRVRSVALAAFANQEIPFELLLDEFLAARLQVNFHYDAGLRQPLSLPEAVTIEVLPTVSVGTVYELSLSVLEDPNGLRLEIEYNTALFDAETIERMLGHYQRLLQSAVADPTQAISALALLTSDEQQRLAPTGNNVTPPARLEIRPPLVERVMAKPDAVAARHGRRELSCAELLARMESARYADKSDRAPSDLDQAAAWVAHWRARVETPPPAVLARPPEVEVSVAAACVALRDCAQFVERERVASCSGGLAATEELGAALLANALLVYPTPELFAGTAASFATWLEDENIAVAFLPAALWNRLRVSIAARKARKPAKLRMVIVTEGDAAEGSFGRVDNRPLDGVRVCQRMIFEAAGGTLALDGRMLSTTAGRLTVLALRSGQPLPIGIAGELGITNSLGRATGTGELARWLPNKMIDRLGLLEAQSYARGFRTDLRQTEMALCTLPGVRHALVRPANVEPGSPFIAYVLPDPAVGPLPSNGDLRQSLREQRLPDLAIPSAFVALKSIPLRADNGQLELSALPPLPEGGLDGAPEPVRPYLGLQLQLIAIWEEVLGVRGIGIRDDFFDLGGNSLLAMRMLQRAEVACGKVILPSALFRNPTVEHLAGEMAREARDESPMLLRVHDTGARTPFFYLHGDLSGGGFYSLKLSRALGPDQPFYVLPPQDIRTLSAAPSIEEMATAHLEALRAVRPNGPYVIGGFCISGLVAYELAQQLKASGETVEMLLIIDAAPDRTLRVLRSATGVLGAVFRWSGEKRVAHFGRCTVWRARLALRFAPKRGGAVQAPSRSILTRFGRRSRKAAPPASPEVSDSAAPPERDLPSIFQWASAGYRPRPYDGPVALLLSEDVLGHADNVSRAWQQLAPAVTVEPLQGSHLECITEHVEALADKIQGCLERAGANELPGSASLPSLRTASIPVTSAATASFR